MLLDLYIFFEIVVIGLFIASFFTRNLIMWFLTLLFAGVLMVTSYNVEYYTYIYNQTISAYSPLMITYSYPYLSAINMVFFGLSLLFGIWDIFAHRNEEK